MFLFDLEREENTASDDEPFDKEAQESNVDGFSSCEESDNNEDISTSIPICIKNTRLKKANFEGDLASAAKIHDILDYISSLGLDLPLFLDAMSWGSPECHSDRKIQYARTSLLASKELPQILRRWFKPPRRMKEGKGMRPAGARETRDLSSSCILVCIASERIIIIILNASLPAFSKRSAACLTLRWCSPKRAERGSDIIHVKEMSPRDTSVPFPIEIHQTL